MLRIIIGKMNEITPFYFAMKIRGSVRYSLGKEYYSRRSKEVSRWQQATVGVR